MKSPMTTALERWHEVVRTRDASRLVDLLADAVVFHSPVVHTPQEGRTITTKYLAAALDVLGPGLHYVREVVGERDAMLEFVTEIDGIHVNGVDLVRCDEDGRIVDFKVMVRPLKAIQVLHAKMGAKLAG